MSTRLFSCTYRLTPGRDSVTCISQFSSPAETGCIEHVHTSIVRSSSCEVGGNASVCWTRRAKHIATRVQNRPAGAVQYMWRKFANSSRFKVARRFLNVCSNSSLLQPRINVHNPILVLTRHFWKWCYCETPTLLGSLGVFLTLLDGLKP